MPIRWVKRSMEVGEIRRRFEAERDAALRDVGQFVRAKAATYEGRPVPSTNFYRRTGSLGRSIAVSEPEDGHGGRFVEVGTNLHYARYVEEGTGIYGPEGRPIVPKTAKALAWRSTGTRGPASRVIATGVVVRKGKLRRMQQRNVYMNFARSVRGMKPWHFMRGAFEDPASAAYMQARVKRMFENVKRET